MFWEPFFLMLRECKFVYCLPLREPVSVFCLEILFCSLFCLILLLCKPVSYRWLFLSLYNAENTCFSLMLREPVYIFIVDCNYLSFQLRELVFVYCWLQLSLFNVEITCLCILLSKLVSIYCWEHPFFFHCRKKPFSLYW